MKGHPMLQSSENWMALFNEFMVSIYLYVSITLTGASANPFYNNCGTALMGVIILTAASNLLYFLIMTIKTIARSCKAKWDKIHRAKIGVKEQYKPEEEKKKEEVPEQIEEEKQDIIAKTKSRSAVLEVIIEELSV